MIEDELVPLDSWTRVESGKTYIMDFSVSGFDRQNNITISKQKAMAIGHVMEAFSIRKDLEGAKILSMQFMDADRTLRVRFQSNPVPFVIIGAAIIGVLSIWGIKVGVKAIYGIKETIKTTGETLIPSMTTFMIVGGAIFFGYMILKRKGA